MAPSEPPTELLARDVGFRYGQLRVLDRVSLVARPGEVTGLIGPNGSGKSTLIRILSGVLRGYEGSACIGTDEVRALSAREIGRRLAVVPQETQVGFPFTALEVALLGRHPHLAGLQFESEDDVAIARQALARCGVLDLAERRIQDLSSGERQRVIFAKALAQRPRALLLDEPVTFLDIRHQVGVCQIARELAAGGATVLAVLHDLNLAAAYCDRIYLLDRGRIAAEGPPRQVLTPDHLRRVFATDVHVAVDEVTGRLILVPWTDARPAGGRAPS